MIKNLLTWESLGWGLWFAVAMLFIAFVTGCTVSGTIDPETGQISGSIQTIWDGKGSE